MSETGMRKKRRSLECDRPYETGQEKRTISQTATPATHRLKIRTKKIPEKQQAFPESVFMTVRPQGFEPWTH